jgi:5'-methylthioadenosine phosphorylase
MPKLERRTPEHIKAKHGDVAERVIVSGDPARVVQLSKKLKRAKSVSENRGFLVYTGEYDDKPFTVACHGVGMPSTAITVEELIMLGARAIVRFGSCGALLKSMKIGDLIIATGAAYLGGGTLQAYVKEGSMTPVPSFDLTSLLVLNATKKRISHIEGPVYSSDAFYAEDPNFVAKWSNLGYVAVEMECATIFGLGMIRGIKTGSALLVSNNLAKMQPIVDAQTLHDFVDRASAIVFESLSHLEV